ncbi:FtsX-like permease family protein, partial [Enterococcus faecalis]|uniref:FtsX-like permease family protein n=1 Tax=Enterococcus faecalis TaxID=1351 RepID=UPI003CC514A8
PKELNITFLTAMKGWFDDLLKSLDIVIWVLIAVSGSLALIVLNNLTNINVSERIRELSTIKVLGFYDREVTTYVYRENIILTFIGII